MTRPALTIGMATYKDFDGVFFTIQALRMYQDLTDTELLVIDNFATGRREVVPSDLDRLTLVEGSVADAGLVERCFARLKQFRDLATRYAKRLAYWRSELVIATIVLWLR